MTVTSIVAASVGAARRLPRAFTCIFHLYILHSSISEECDWASVATSRPLVTQRPTTRHGGRCNASVCQPSNEMLSDSRRRQTTPGAFDSTHGLYVVYILYTAAGRLDGEC